jgi:hypothetical protein
MWTEREIVHGFETAEDEARARALGTVGATSAMDAFNGSSI